MRLMWGGEGPTATMHPAASSPACKRRSGNLEQMRVDLHATGNLMNRLTSIGYRVSRSGRATTVARWEGIMTTVRHDRRSGILPWPQVPDFPFAAPGTASGPLQPRLATVLDVARQKV